MENLTTGIDRQLGHQHSNSRCHFLSEEITRILRVFLRLTTHIFSYFLLGFVSLRCRRLSVHVSGCRTVCACVCVSVLICACQSVCVLVCGCRTVCAFLCLSVLVCACLSVCVLICGCRTVCACLCLSMLICACLSLSVLDGVRLCLSMLVCACLWLQARLYDKQYRVRGLVLIQTLSSNYGADFHYIVRKQQVLLSAESYVNPWNGVFNIQLAGCYELVNPFLPF